MEYNNSLVPACYFYFFYRIEYNLLSETVVNGSYNSKL